MSQAIRLFPQGNAAFYNWADNFRIGIQDTATSAALNLPPLAEQIMITHWQQFAQAHLEYVVQMDKSPAKKAEYYYYR
ncbi:MAG: hypothetical protein LBR17_03900, partial [Bacteroidales bacterium]|nr:hypothetical protein [Bacteroidales bacterium]